MVLQPARVQGITAPFPSFLPSSLPNSNRRFGSPNQILQTLPKSLDTQHNTTHRYAPLPPSPAVLHETTPSSKQLTSLSTAT